MNIIVITETIHDPEETITIGVASTIAKATELVNQYYVNPILVSTTEPGESNILKHFVLSVIGEGYNRHNVVISYELFTLDKLY